MPRFQIVAMLSVVIWGAGAGIAGAQDRPLPMADGRGAQVFAAALFVVLSSARAQAPGTASAPPAEPAPKENPALLRRAGHLSPSLEETGLVQQE